MSNRRGGIIQLQINGEIQDCVGSFSYNLGRNKKEGKVGSDVVHGYIEKPQVPFIEGEITDRSDLDLSELVNTSDATITLILANDKAIVLRNAWYAGDGTASTEEGNIEVRFEGLSADEV
jgi:hypothetical protein